MSWGMPGPQSTQAPDPGKGGPYQKPTVGLHGLPAATVNAATSAFNAATKKNTPPQNPYGSESGPGILESWFKQRANGTDPGYEYAMKRGMDSIDSRMAAGGSYNSGARGQQLSDFGTSMGAAREGQLDALAAGASGEHQNRFNSMISQLLGSAGGQAGTMGAYDLASARSNDALMDALVQMMGGKAGVDDKSRQQGIGNAIGIGSLFA